MIKALFTFISAVALVALAVALPTDARAAVPAGNTGWNWSNPLPQGNSLVRVASGGGRLWVGGATGTLLFSDDNGQSWSAVRTGLLDDVRTVEPISQQSVVFAGRCALRRSDDGGMTVRRLAWSASDDACAAEIKDVAFPTPMTGHVLLTNGDIYLTTDGGVSFSKQSVAPNSQAAGGSGVVGDLFFTTPQKGLVSVDGKIFRSIDGGLGWAPVSAPSDLVGGLDFAFAGPLNGFAAGANGTLLRTADGGESWQPVTPLGTFSGESLSSLACSDALQCVAVGARGMQLLRTVDGGASWSVTSQGQGLVLGLGLAADGRALAVGPGGLMLVSDDHGVTWTRADRQASGVFRGLRSGSGRVAWAFGDSGALAITRDGGGTWKQTTVPGDRTIVDAVVSGNRIYVLDRSGLHQRSLAEGSEWSDVKVRTRGKPSGVMAWKDGRVMLVGARGVLVISGREGTAPGAPKSLLRTTLSSVDFAGSSVFVHGSKQIAVTRDRGVTWRRLKKPSGSGTIARLDMVDAKRGYLLDKRAELFVTSDAGRRWKRIETTGANSAVTMAFGDRKHGYIGDSAGRILATSDAGATWSRQYPFFDATEHSPLSIVGVSRLGAFALVRGTNQIFSTTTAGHTSVGSTLTIRPSLSRVRPGTIVPVTGRLLPATGVERVSVLARVVGARGGTKWVTQNATVSASGTFTTKWKITADTVLIARWSGDALHDGDAAPLRTVRVRR
jgi:photosystem II stability/assembly factor-like uncharacterized protein